MEIARISDRKELQALALIQAETADLKKQGVVVAHLYGSKLLAQAPHLAWSGASV